MTSLADKTAFRARARAARQAIADSERLPLARALTERLLGLESASAPVILGYAASAEEIDPAPALTALAARGATIALPRIAGPHTLTLHTCPHAEELEVGSYGIRQPCEEMPLIEPDRIGLVIVPGVAYDRHGRRIGYGAGYYDRLLAQMPDAYRVGIAYDGQVFDELPEEPHDIRMHALLTPTQTLQF